jgi:hypothetical protein
VVVFATALFYKIQKMSLITNYWDIFRSDKLKEKFEEVDNTIYVEEVELTAANIIAMNATPVTVVAAKGAGKVIEFVSATAIFDYGTVQFTGGGNFYFETEDGYTVSQNTGASALTGAADSISFIYGTNVTADLDNQALKITNATAAFADGDGVLRLKVAYRVHSTGL